MRTSRLVWIAALILLITMGIRQSMGLLIRPIHEASGIGITEISFALAISQLIWGLSQPLWGVLSETIGTVAVVISGSLLIAVGLVGSTLFLSPEGLLFFLGICLAAGAGAGSFSILIGSVAQKVEPRSRALAAGLINAGGSLGQCLIAPLTQTLITTWGWISSLYTLGVLALITLPLAFTFKTTDHAVPARDESSLSLSDQLKIASRDRSYICLHLGFLTCGFHVAFLVTHLPSEVALCGLNPSVAASTLAIIGLANVFGSLVAGVLGNYVRMKWILAVMYLSRTLAIALYLLANKTPGTFYLFGLVLGGTWLATVPPTSGLTAKLFGTRHLATLFGLTLISHQIGAFFGAWLGGIALLHTGNLQILWEVDAALALGAALINLPIREAPIERGVT